MLTQYGLRQHVTDPTHISGNTLDLILSRDEQISEQLVSKVAVQSVCFSDHHLLTCYLRVPLPQPVTTTYTTNRCARLTRQPAAPTFCSPSCLARRSSTLTAADLFDAEVRRVLDVHAPLRTGRRRCGQYDNRHLSDKARQAKQQRRRLERRYRRTGLQQSGKEAYLSGCSTARESILKSRTDHTKSELDQAAGDVRATWRMAQRLAQQTVVYDDAQCVQLVSMFCQFFVDNISAALQSSARRTFIVRQHFGPQPSTFEPVTTEEVRKLTVVRHAIQVVTTRCPATLDTDVMRPRVCASHCQTHQHVTPDWKVSDPIQERASASTAEEGLALQFTGRSLTCPRVQGPRETRVGTPAAPPAQPVPVRMQKGTLHTKKIPRQSVARMLHWLPVQQRIDYKVALLTFKVHSTSTPSYLRHLIQDREHSHNLRSTSTTLCQPFTTTTFAKRAFRCSAQEVWNSLPKSVLNSDSVAVFKSRLKTFLFSQAFSSSSAH